MSALLTILAQAPGLNASGWFMLIGCIGLVCMLCASCFWKILTEPKTAEQHDAPESTSEQLAPHVPVRDPQLAGIGGWLILPAIGCVSGPIIGVLGLIVSLALLSEVADAGYGFVLGLEILVLICFLCFQVYAAFRFFGKKQNAPSTIIALFIASVVVSGLLLVHELGAGAVEFAIQSGKGLLCSIVGAAIWIPYFRKSKRVKATFVR